MSYKISSLQIRMSESLMFQMILFIFLGTTSIIVFKAKQAVRGRRKEK